MSQHFIKGIVQDIREYGVTPNVRLSVDRIAKHDAKLAELVAKECEANRAVRNYVKERFED